MPLTYVTHERLNLKAHPEYSEKWVQNLIAANPAMLGLGKLDLRDMERRQPSAGRLDLLLQDPEAPCRYEVELQLGATDERHIIRTLEYWDIERKRYPQYEHYAVLIAEEINRRFLNVIGLFNGNVPLIAIQMSALKIEDRITLAFTTVFDAVGRGMPDEDEEVNVPTDRTYWIGRSGEALGIVDSLYQIFRQCDPSLELKYNKRYIGLSPVGQSSNLATFRPRKKFIILGLRLPLTDDITAKIDAAEIETLSYAKWGMYRLRLADQDVRTSAALLKELIKLACSYQIS